MVESRVLGQLGRVAPCVLAISLSVMPGLAAADSSEAWVALVKGSHVALIRHGNAPPGYGGDPPGVKIDDCLPRGISSSTGSTGESVGERMR